MKLFDVGQEANGFVAIGQIATGFVAIGQMATGVIAIGQLARGIVAIGMASIGLVTVGMVSGGVFHATAMLGLAGLGGRGIVLPLMPFPGVKPLDTRKAEVVFGEGKGGWCVGELTMASDRVPRFVVDGVEQPCTVALPLTQAARDRAASGEPSVAVYVARGPESLVIERIVAVPGLLVSKPRVAVMRALQLGLLVGVCVGFYEAVAMPLLELLLSGK